MTPRILHRSSLENRVMLALAGLIAGVGGIWITYSVSANGGKTASEPPPVVARIAETPKKIPDGLLPQDFTARVIDFCAKEVKTDRSFVVFRHGTCVMVAEPVEDPLAAAIAILKEAAEPAAVFATAEEADGSVLVTYRQKLFQHFGAAHVRDLRSWLIDGYERLMTARELSAKTEKWNVPETTRIGLLGRWCLMRDAEELQPARIIRARQNHSVSAR